MSKNKKFWNRREFLETLSKAGVCATMWEPLCMLFGTLFDGMVSKAQAAESGVPPRKLLFIYMFGGPPRWAFDYTADPFNTGRTNIGTLWNTFNSNGSTGYRLIPITSAGKTYYLPPLWAHQVPRPGGGFAPMADLLRHMLVVRGIYMPPGEHQLDNYLLRPVSTSLSLDGILADHSTAPTPAISLGGNQTFASGTGKSIFSPNLSNTTATDTPLHRAAPNYKGQTDSLPTGFIARRDALELGIQSVLTALSDYASSSRPGAQVLYADRKNAEDALRSSVGDLTTVWNTLYAKYSTLLTRCNGEVNRLIPVAIPKDKSTRIGEMHPNNADLRTSIVPTTGMRNFARNLALTEFLFTRNLCSSITTYAGGLGGIEARGYTLYTKGGENTVASSSATGIKTWESGGDEHFTGAKASVLYNTMMYYHFATGFYELIESLKRANVFQDTVIQLASEMGRRPRDDMTGSEHAVQANLLSLWSGAIQEPLFIGNVQIDTRYQTRGVGEYVTLNGTRTLLNWEHAISTAAKLLRIPTPFSRAPAVVQEQNGTVVSLIGNPENR
jgi:hypothetical protein